ncbi:PDZ and LIM domain protein 7 [Echinops telfairi]|uniref:PDZ and LIM domain protein 7 n=1 Tax=Echinops telfairi TaxID=9371 RepID=A0AC55CNB2_ECHTE|nr:PDZ and LIM domain protein 7 [Echinops telfairi]
MDSFKVVLEGPAPWGFRLQGGKDFNVPLSISRLTPGGKAMQAGVAVGDWVLSIDGENAGALTHIEAQNKIRACGESLSLGLSRAQPAQSKPQKAAAPAAADSPRYTFAPSASLNKTARPFGASPPADDTPAQNGYVVGLSTAHASPAPEKYVLELQSPRYTRLRDWHHQRLALAAHQHQHQPGSGRHCHPCLPGLGNKHSRPCSLCLCLLSLWVWFTLEVLLRASLPWALLLCSGSPWEGGTCRPATLELELSLSGLNCPALQFSLSQGSPRERQHQDWVWGGGGACQLQPCRALNHRSCSQVPRTEAPAPASVTTHEPWPDIPLESLSLAPAGPTTPSPTSRPPWAVDPAFAERYAPDKTSTVLTRHSQPATPTPMQNRTSIVQAAAGGGGGGGGSDGRTPVCHECHKVIRGRYLVALGHAYHPEEFVCNQCGKVLEEGGFFEEKGAIFCPTCYDVRYAPNCAKCKKKITGEIMHALKMTWHVHCFTCAACKTPIRNRAFYMEEGAPYCERDYEKMFGTQCRGCDFKIDAGDRFLEALGFSWHDTCFVCAICQINLEGKTFYSKKDKPLCKSHAFSHV